MARDDGARAQARASELLPEEKAAGSDDPLNQAKAILDESEQRQGDRNAAPGAALEHRRSEDTVEPVGEERGV
jgi:hypothetical protein